MDTNMTESGFSEQSRLSEKERFALQKVNECAPQFALEYPQIVEDAQNMSAVEIASKYGVSELYGVTGTIALVLLREHYKHCLHQNNVAMCLVLGYTQ